MSAAVPATQAANGRERVTVDGAQVDAATGAATRTEHVSEGHAGDGRGADGWRPPHLMTGSNRRVPALDDAHGLVVRGTIRGGLAYGGGYVEASGADAHQASVARMINRRGGRLTKDSYRFQCYRAA